MDLIDRKTLARLVERYDAEAHVKHFGCRQQLICMAFAQLTWREGLRDIATCINARPEARYHLGFREPVSKSTLAEANETRDWRVWEAVAQGLMRTARPLYAGDELAIGIAGNVYAIDSTTIDLCLTLFPWANFRSTKSGIKMHTQIDLRGTIPTCIHIDNARKSDVLWLDQLCYEAGAFYLFDRGYFDWARLSRIVTSSAFFVTRAKDNMRFTRQRSQPVDVTTGLRSDHIGKPKQPNARAAYPHLLRRVRFYDSEHNRYLIFLTNNLVIPALTVTRLYRLRWRIELFFRWIKQHLRIKHYFGTSANAVKTQIWIAVSVYLMVAILHKQLNLPGDLHRTYQILSIHPFEKVPINELLAESNSNYIIGKDDNQLMFSDL